jgi:XTP/dITP diphosphohydrolase
MPEKTPLVLATSNAHKATELQHMLDIAGLPFDVLTLTDVGFHGTIEETGVTFEENALIKAVEVHRATGLPVLADDSGLEVDVLNGAPGVRSARYAGADATDSMNRTKLRSDLIARDATSSPARFRCVICVVDSMRIHLTEGVSHGHVHIDERGGHGFGYDAMFIPLGADKTYGEMTPSEKHQTSHRSKAMSAMVDVLSAVAVLPTSLTLLEVRHLLIDVALCAMTTDVDQLEQAIRRVPTLHHRELYEVLLQSYLFGGFPTALDGLSAAYRIHGIPPSVGDVDRMYDVAQYRKRGESLCREIYGSVYDKMTSTLSEVSPDLATWMIVEGYGKTLSREGVDTCTRELCIVAMLTVLGRQQQLVSHVRGALRVGATFDDLRAVEHAVTELYGVGTSTRLLDLIHLQERRLADQGG